MCHQVCNLPDSPIAQSPHTNDIGSEAFRTAKTVVRNEVNTTVEALGERVVVSCAAATPLLLDGRAIGALEVYSAVPNSVFTKADSQVLKLTAAKMVGFRNRTVN